LSSPNHYFLTEYYYFKDACDVHDLNAINNLKWFESENSCQHHEVSDVEE